MPNWVGLRVTKHTDIASQNGLQNIPKFAQISNASAVATGSILNCGEGLSPVGCAQFDEWGAARPHAKELEELAVSSPRATARLATAPGGTAIGAATVDGVLGIAITIVTIDGEDGFHRIGKVAQPSRARHHNLIVTRKTIPRVKGRALSRE